MDILQHLNVFVEERGPEMNTGFEVQLRDVTLSSVETEVLISFPYLLCSPVCATGLTPTKNHKHYI